MTEEDFSIVHEYIPEREIARFPEGSQIMPKENNPKQLTEAPEPKITVEVTGRLGYSHAYDHVVGDEKSEKRMETLFSRYVNREIRDLTIRSD